MDTITEDETRATYTVPEVGRLLGVGRNRAYELVKNGTVPAIRFGSRWVVPRAAFHAWLDGVDSEAV